MREILLTLGILVVSLTMAVPAFATGLAVTSIGNLDTSTGTFYNAWWYTKENPTLSGTAGANATVTVDIDGNLYTTTADTLGNWSYTPTTLTTGNHTVTVTSGTETVSFSLEIGSDTSTAGTATSPTPTTAPTTLPDSGVGSITVFMILGALVATGVGTYSFVFTKGK